MAEKVNYQQPIYDSQGDWRKVRKDYGDPVSGSKLPHNYSETKGDLFGRPWESSFRGPVMAWVDKSGAFHATLASDMPKGSSAAVLAVLSLKPVLPMPLVNPQIYKLLDFDESVFAGIYNSL